MPRSKSQPHFVFVCGGVLSGLGKGIVTSSIGVLLKARQFSVVPVKIDPYISIDAGTMRPAEHGEVFVTRDGGELDQDLGNYERFLDIELSKNHNITTGKAYQNVITHERSFRYQGRDAELFPDLINEIKAMILDNITNEDFCLVEIGGTTGDLENQPFLYAARELGREYPSVYILVTYLPFLRNTGELKTKPTQHAVHRLTEIGIFPDLIITRNEIPIDQPRIETIAKRCCIDPENIIDDPDVDCVYRIPLILEKSRVTERILEKLTLKVPPRPNLNRWKRLVKGLTDQTAPLVKIGLVGKYVQHGSTKHNDVYVSVVEALRHAGVKNGVRVEVVPLDASQFEKAPRRLTRLKEMDGVVVPQGWGKRGAEGKIKAISYARRHKIPYLGLCYGMQLAVVEFARTICKLKDAHSTEVNPQTPFPVIHIMPDQKEYLAKNQYGGTIRLGDWPCRVEKGTHLFEAYKTTEIKERHRHRYELNNEFREVLVKKGLVISGASPDGKLVEAIELSEDEHPFFVGTQFHPEYKSRPLRPHPLFVNFVKAAKKTP